MTGELYAYMDCRDLRHAWAREDDEVKESGRGVVNEFSRVLVCMRCGTTRKDDFIVIRRDRQNYVARLGARYVYPKGYAVRGGINIEQMRWDLFHTVRKVVKR